MKPMLWLATILLENTWDSLLAVPAPFLELERAKLSPFPINRPNFFYGRDLRDPVSRIIIWLRNPNKPRNLNPKKIGLIRFRKDSERYGQLTDPFGHHWSLSEQIKMSKAERDEKQKQAMAMFSQGQHPEASMQTTPAQ